jgi:thioredoxin reductase (NADPH)
LIISTGAEAKWLGLDSELKYQGFGVSACATCDGFFYRGKQVAVVGGGNTAVEEAIYLTKHATKVMLIHRRNSLRAEKMLQKRLLANPKIEIIWDSALEEVMGKHEGPMPEVTGIRVRNIKTDNITEYSLEGVFIAIGHQPNTSIFVNQLKMDEEGYLITQPDSTATNIPGIFAAGDVQDNKFRQAVTAAGTGCMAALETEKYLASIVNQTTMAAQ